MLANNRMFRPLIVVLLIMLILCGYFYYQNFLKNQTSENVTPSKSTSKLVEKECPQCPKQVDEPKTIAPYKPVPPIKKRYELGDILEAEGATLGVEIGVERGIFSDQMLKRWKSVKEYVWVDPWAPNAEYIKAEADKVRANHGESKIPVCRGFSVPCSKNYPDNYFDFVYVDALHSYEGANDDIRAWWPKLKVGGIMAGHDFYGPDDVPIPGFDFGVKKAVLELMERTGHQVTVTYQDDATFQEKVWPSWYMRK